MYIDHTRPPFVDITLPPAIILPSYLLVLLYSAVLLLDFYLLSHDRHKQLLLILTIYHIAIPMIFISNSQPLNILFASVPWFLASYSAHMPTDNFSLKNWSDAMVAITIEDDTDEQYIIDKRRLKGAATIALGVFKIAFCHLFINPLLPHHPEDALEYAWMHPLSLLYTLLFGVKAYCLLGFIEIFLGLQQVAFRWKMVNLNNYPILSNSPRDFWSRRWNKVIRNLLHSQIFAPASIETDDNVEQQLMAPPATPEPTQKKLQKRTKRPTTATKRVTRSSTRAAAAAAASASSAEEPTTTDDEKTLKKITQKMSAQPYIPSTPFWSTRRGRGLLAFIVSGVFHELIIMSTCRKITLENLIFFTIEGILVMLEVDLRQEQYKQEPTGKTRVICIFLQLLHLSIIGRLFTGPFLRYKFLS